MKSLEEPLSEINIIPFVDILLVILVVFIITTPYLIKYQIQIQLTQTQNVSEKSQQDLTKVFIFISKNKQIVINGKKASLEDISKNLKNKKLDSKIHLAADKNTPHGEVIKLMDVLKKIGFYNFNMIVDKK